MKKLNMAEEDENKQINHRTAGTGLKQSIVMGLSWSFLALLLFFDKGLGMMASPLSDKFYGALFMVAAFGSLGGKLIERFLGVGK